MNAVTEGKKDETDLTKLVDGFFLVAFFPNYSKTNEKQQIKQTKHSSCLNMGPLKKTNKKTKQWKGGGWSHAARDELPVFCMNYQGYVAGTCSKSVFLAGQFAVI